MEKGNGEALAARTQHPVLGRADPACRPLLERLAEVDHQSALERWHIDPSAGPRSRLKPRNPVLRQQGEKAGVRVGRADQISPCSLEIHPHLGIPYPRELGGMPRWISDQPQCRKSAAKRLVEVVL